jgi:hypothetical protein
VQQHAEPCTLHACPDSPQLPPPPPQTALTAFKTGTANRIALRCWLTSAWVCRRLVQPDNTLGAGRLVPCGARAGGGGAQAVGLSMFWHLTAAKNAAAWWLSA